MTLDLDGTQLYRTLTGNKLHIPPCPHPNAPLREATGAERIELDLCLWCSKELSGEGRINFPTLEAALTSQGIMDDRRQQIAQLVKGVPYDDVYIPNSRVYIGLADKAKRTTLAWVHKSALDVVGRERVWFLGAPTGKPQGKPADAEKWGGKCPSCGLVRSLNGACGCQ